MDGIINEPDFDLSPTPLQLECERLRAELATQAEQIKVALSAIELYEQAMFASWPNGAMGDAFDYWNTARITRAKLGER